MKHPAKFTDRHLDEARKFLGAPGKMVLDPFAGVGTVHKLRPDFETYGVELEPEWACASPYTYIADALVLPFGANTFDAIVTSPTFGNRMADHHEARDDSRRNTYRHVLGRELSISNSGGMQWGPQYRIFHIAAWQEAIRVLKPGGLFIVNLKDHIRRGHRQRVTDWHLEVLQGLGLTHTDTAMIPTRGLAMGENSAVRINYETVERLVASR